MSPQFAAALKRFEVAWRSTWIRTLTRLMRREDAPAPPNWDARPHHVLFLRHDRIGDMILSTGLLRAIATSHRTIVLDVLASPGNAPVLRGDAHVRDVVIFDRTKPARYLATLRRLRRTKYDAVIDCMPTAPSLTTLLLMWASGATHRIGVAGRGNDDVLTLPVPPHGDAVHIVDRLAALAAPFGVDRHRTSFHPELRLDARERERATAAWSGPPAGSAGRRLLVNISAGRAFRRWPEECFVAVIRQALARDPRLHVIVISAPGDRGRAQAIADSAGVRLEPTPTLREALALVATADLLVTPDTGIAHAASAFNRPAVVMYVQGTAAQWGLYRSPGYELSSKDGTLDSLAPDAVLDAVSRLLTDGKAVRSRAVAKGDFGHLVR